MTMNTSAPVNVLAVMKLARNNLVSLGCRGSAADLDEARAAVAELVEQASIARLLLANTSSVFNLSGFTQQIADLDAALAKFA